MKKCLIVINEMSGHAARIDTDALRRKFSVAYDVDFAYVRSRDDEWSADGYDLVVACGGDGTFNRALNLCSQSASDLIYYGYGTFNECAKAKGTRPGGAEFIRLYEYASVGDKYFGYVAAAGSFTPLGYIVKPEKKQKLGIFAYLLEVIKQYRVCDIAARIAADDEEFSGRFTLIMAIDSMRCFGFRFNRLYRPDDGKIHLLLIRTPKVGGLLGKIAVFFPLFRAFFIGFNKEVRSRNLVFRAVSEATFSLDEPQIFDVDGDAVTLQGYIRVSVKKPAGKIYIGDASMLR